MKKTLGIRHIAIKVKNFEKCLNFYTNILEMKIDWKPDAENAYLTNGQDNLALHLDKNLNENSNQNRLDHFGIMLNSKEEVDNWYKHIKSNNIKIFKDVHDHRDGSRSFYCYDPDDNIIQIIWHPTISKDG
ncbi:MAG: VOC family protein [Pseudomonadota bacterium]|nr:VOC family protein [Pseudomonadota bacterium]